MAVMISPITATLLIFLILVESVVVSQTNSPRVFLLDAKQLQATRQRLHRGDKTFAQAWGRLESEAQKALNAGPFFVKIESELK